MDLAHIIKGLLSAELAFRILTLLMTHTLRSAFLLWGWQPSFIIQIMFELQRINGGTLGDVSKTHFINMSGTGTWNSTSIHPALKGFGELYFVNKTHMITDEERVAEALAGMQVFENVCFLPASLMLTTRYGTTIFVLMTGVVR